ncbi:MAG TPA: hypothetical protein VLL54_01815 [Pyrinomonadaceae bacterium]|nr:hypothetical protein [Pyrinomonadaceae bacterium]
MRRKKKTTITFESRERTTIRHGVLPATAWCEWCRADVLPLSPNEAAALAGSDMRAILRGIEVGRIHLIEGDEKGLRVCSQSILRK